MLINSFSTCIYHARSKGAVPPFFSEGGGHWGGTISETLNREGKNGKKATESKIKGENFYQQYLLQCVTGHFSLNKKLILKISFVNYYFYFYVNVLGLKPFLTF